ncbi:alanyl-tRNA editing protein [Brucepastera parasyntrophica]|uniref:alanyl-tRNA editing protein n=1 Tax=Brucepastera parasyntrophica TaxID=2880008 RepID=UPI00210D11FA|nr:alanyl-tRNA editing protein [Brucepastera parasyntrophica]ULQ59025.1 alanyl-tRNA editing protein [Brucepastera parasyntrophica]
MELFYQTDSYCRTLETLIENIDTSDNSVQFEKTIIYPGGGGQPYDFAFLTCGDKRYAVSGTKKNEFGIWYILDALPPSPGAPVTMEIDWDRRYAFMRSHTAMHILCGVIWRDYRKAVTGGNMDILKGRLDFEFAELNKDMLPELERKVNEEIKAAREIQIIFADDSTNLNELIRTKENLIPKGVDNIRLIEITGLDTQADGGTHVKNTSEVGSIKITDIENKGKNNKRVKMEIT